MPQDSEFRLSLLGLLSVLLLAVPVTAAGFGLSGIDIGNEFMKVRFAFYARYAASLTA
jgi:hypothetical protein